MPASKDSVPSVSTCLVCRLPLAGRPVTTCPSCETVLHSDCAQYLGGCARFACVEAATPRGRVVKFLQARLTASSGQLLGLALIGALPLVQMLTAGLFIKPFLVLSGIITGLILAKAAHTVYLKWTLSRPSVPRQTLLDLFDRFFLQAPRETPSAWAHRLWYGLSACMGMRALKYLFLGFWNGALSMGLTALACAAMAYGYQISHKASQNAEQMVRLWRDELLALGGVAAQRVESKVRIEGEISEVTPKKLPIGKDIP